MQITKEKAERVFELVDKGLTNGLGNPEPGKMCIEAAICYAFGEDHGDAPLCVSRAVRTFAIYLNDSKWSSKKARAKGMRGLAVAQLGSVDIDDEVFVKELVRLILDRIVHPNNRRIVEFELIGRSLESKAERIAEAVGNHADTSKAPRDRTLTMAAACAVKALRKAKSPGCEWLELCSSK